jgi:TatD DNase family protein
MTAPPSPAPIELVDSHAHLDFPELAGRLDAVVERANAAGVAHIVTVGTSYEAAVTALGIARRFPCVSAAAGIHPNYVAEKLAGFDDLRRLFDTEPLVAVGETGLDFYREHTPHADQEAAFRLHIELALDKDLPLVIHIRDAQGAARAYDRALEILDAAPRMPRGVFHCFSGTTQFAREAVARGFLISIAGQVTFKNAEALRATVATIPLERLLVETDCPYLAPVPNRGKDNEPAFVRHTADRVAEILATPFETVARATTDNARKLFSIAD